jgi:hypothetical protein
MNTNTLSLPTRALTFAGMVASALLVRLGPKPVNESKHTCAPEGISMSFSSSDAPPPA